LIIDERAARADEAVEQGGLPDVRPADNGNREGHEAICKQAAVLREWWRCAPHALFIPNARA
jgi:hypothetical protein